MKMQSKKMRLFSLGVAILVVAVFVVSCGDVSVPRPRGYFRIEMPKHEYVAYDSVGAPYEFEVSKNCEVQPDDVHGEEKYWVNIIYPQFNCKIHVTYRNMKGSVDESLEDSRRLAYKHTVKADAIGESYYDNDSLHVYGVLYMIKGNAASPLQFSLTDSMNHIFRGSLYFNCKPNKDSLAPVVEYIEEDVVRMIETFRWRN